MQLFTIKYHSPAAAAPPSSFFILSHGRHAGRPAYSPNPNYFVFIMRSAGYILLLLVGIYVVDYPLFEPILKGTCIEFARVADVRRLIAESTPHIVHIETVVNNLQKLQVLESKFLRSI